MTTEACGWYVRRNRLTTTTSNLLVAAESAIQTRGAEQTGFDARADVNEDGILHVLDLPTEARLVPAQNARKSVQSGKKKFARRGRLEQLQGTGRDEGDVGLLFVGIVPADIADDGGDQVAGRVGLMAAKGGDQTLFAEFFIVAIEGFGDAVGEQEEGVAGR